MRAVHCASRVVSRTPLAIAESAPSAANMAAMRPMLSTRTGANAAGESHEVVVERRRFVSSRQYSTSMSSLRATATATATATASKHAPKMQVRTPTDAPRRASAGPSGGETHHRRLVAPSNAPSPARHDGKKTHSELAQGRQTTTGAPAAKHQEAPSTVVPRWSTIFERIALAEHLPPASPAQTTGTPMPIPALHSRSMQQVSRDSRGAVTSNQKEIARLVVALDDGLAAVGAVLADCPKLSIHHVRLAFKACSVYDGVWEAVAMLERFCLGSPLPSRAATLSPPASLTPGFPGWLSRQLAEDEIQAAGGLLRLTSDITSPLIPMLLNQRSNPIFLDILRVVEQQQTEIRPVTELRLCAAALQGGQIEPVLQRLSHSNSTSAITSNPSFLPLLFEGLPRSKALAARQSTTIGLWTWAVASLARSSIALTAEGAQAILNYVRWMSESPEIGQDWSASTAHSDATSFSCSSCGHSLVNQPPSSAVLHKLVEAFTAVYQTRSNLTQTLLRLERFVRQNGPFDMVVDSSNVCHYYQSLRFCPSVLTRVLAEVPASTRVLIISARPTRFENLSSNMHTFVSEAYDDASIILGTLHCQLAFPDHPVTILSNDLLRDHYARLNGDLAIAFAKWCDLVRVGFSIRHPNAAQPTQAKMASAAFLSQLSNASVSLLHPPSIRPFPQHSKHPDGSSSWHLPFQDEAAEDAPSPLKWLCVRSREGQSSSA